MSIIGGIDINRARVALPESQASRLLNQTDEIAVGALPAIGGGWRVDDPNGLPHVASSDGN